MCIRDSYSAALDLADEHKYDKLAKASLTNLASLYVVSGKKQIPHDLLQRIELSARQDTLYGYCLLYTSTAEGAKRAQSKM